MVTIHVSENGVETDAGGMQFVRCECGWQSGPVPGVEAALDDAMQHAYEAGVQDPLP